MNYIIVDLEATCWKTRNKAQQNEIIEIGAVKIDDDRNFQGEFAEFVQPILNPQLSDFCTELTTIEQSDVDAADPFDVVLQRFLQWINPEEEYLLCSWGFYDKVQFKSDCQLHELDTNWLKYHISLKHQYAKIKNLRKPVGMGMALKMEDLQLIGTHHRGIDDARNIANIFLVHLNAWMPEK